MGEKLRASVRKMGPKGECLCPVNLASEITNFIDLVSSLHLGPWV